MVVPPNAVMIVQMLAGHEIDVLANVHGRFALVEAKDGRFEIGHAYPVVAKAQMVHPDLVVVVATGGFDSAAKATLSPSAIFPGRGDPGFRARNSRNKGTRHSLREWVRSEPELGSILDSQVRSVAATAVQDALNAGTLGAADLLEHLEAAL